MRSYPCMYIYIYRPQLPLRVPQHQLMARPVFPDQEWMVHIYINVYDNILCVDVTKRNVISNIYIWMSFQYLFLKKSESEPLYKLGPI